MLPSSRSIDLEVLFRYYWFFSIVLHYIYTISSSIAFALFLIGRA